MLLLCGERVFTPHADFIVVAAALLCFPHAPGCLPALNPSSMRRWCCLPLQLSSRVAGWSCDLTGRTWQGVLCIRDARHQGCTAAILLTTHVALPSPLGTYTHMRGFVFVVTSSGPFYYPPSNVCVCRSQQCCLTKREVPTGSNPLVLDCVPLSGALLTKW